MHCADNILEAPKHLTAMDGGEEVGGGSHQIYNGCIQMEQGAYNILKGRWANVSSRIRNHCHEVASFGGGSYQILQGCVQMEEDAAGNRQSFSFD